MSDTAEVLRGWIQEHFNPSLHESDLLVEALAEIDRLQGAVRKHRDQRGDDRCWLDDEELYAALPEGYTPPQRDTTVELANCKRFIACRHNPSTAYLSPQREIEHLYQEVDSLKEKLAARDTIFQFGDFTLNSGAKSRWKIECDSLTGADIAGLAEMIRQLVGSFSSVEGVPRGGLRLADALRPHAVAGNFPHLIVDDVLTTGGSMERTRVKALTGEHSQVIGAVVFARGPLPHWVKAVFQMPREFWLPSRV